MPPRCALLGTSLWLLLVAAPPVVAQESAAELRRTVAELDEAVFTAFNERDFDQFMTFFSEDLEFYHDQDGLTGHAEMIENSLRLFGQENSLRREIVEGSLEVHRVPGYGAIQLGRHEFCHWENGAEDCGVFGFTHLWRRGDDHWQITRVFSYGH